MRENGTTEDSEALRRCLRDDKQAYGIIVKKYMRRAYFTALGLVGNHDDALDLSQEAFIRAYQALAKFDVQQRFFTWYYKILRNLCLNHLRNRSKLTSLQSRVVAQTPSALKPDSTLLEIPDGSADPSVLAERNDLSERLWKAMATLNDEQREILVLKEFEGCSYKEIAERLDIPKGTVMSRLFNARKHLKEKMGSIV